MQTKDEGPLSEIVRRFHYAEFINNKNRKTCVCKTDKMIVGSENLVNIIQKF